MFSSGAPGVRRASRWARMASAGIPASFATTLRKSSKPKVAAASQVRRAGRNVVPDFVQEWHRNVSDPLLEERILDSVVVMEVADLLYFEILQLEWPQDYFEVH